MAYDFRGRTTTQVRQVFTDIETEADWTGLEAETSLTGIAAWLGADGSLDAETFSMATTYDALDRVVEQVAPDASRTVPGYDAGGQLVSVDVYLRGSATATAFVTGITYNARGQRETIAYGNGTTSTSTYDPQRFWLTRLKTIGAATLQDLQYTHDAVGNITQITDGAQQTVFFANAQVTPDRTFGYDAMYRLVSATGREKVGQTQTTAFYANYAGAPGSIPDTGSPALRQYTQSYQYDEAGNILEMKHQQGLGGAVVWRRGYAYDTGSNRLLSTSLPGDDPDDPLTHSEGYGYNARGAMVFLPHLRSGVASNVTVDFRDQLRKAELDQSGHVAWYAYDSSGQRVRKLWDKGAVREERIYVGPFEVWRRRNGGGAVQEERTTLHVMDDERRIAMAEILTRTGGAAVPTPVPRLRYQLDDHLGTALLEVDETGAVITYEEYHPYGTTAWYAEKNAIQVSAKRYRYTGKERDEETGLSYHGARYYAPWLGRWSATDPAGLVDGPNRYAYAGGNPVGGRDPTGLAGTGGIYSSDEQLLESAAKDWNQQLKDTGFEDKLSFGVTSAGDDQFRLTATVGKSLKPGELPVWMSAVLPMVTGEHGVTYRVKEVAPDAPGTVPAAVSPSERVSYREAAGNEALGIFVPSEGLVRAAAAAQTKDALTRYSAWRSGLGDVQLADPSAPPPADALRGPFGAAMHKSLRGERAVVPSEKLEAEVYIPTTVREGKAEVYVGEKPGTVGESLAHELALHGTQFSPTLRNDLTSRELGAGQEVRIYGPTRDAFEEQVSAGVPASLRFAARRAAGLHHEQHLQYMEPAHAQYLYLWGYSRGK